MFSEPDSYVRNFTRAVSFIFWEAMHGYARGIAGVLAADFIWSTGYAVPSTVLDSTLSHIFAM